MTATPLHQGVRRAELHDADAAEAAMREARAAPVRTLTRGDVDEITACLAELRDGFAHEIRFAQNKRRQRKAHMGRDLVDRIAAIIKGDDCP